MYKAKLGVKYFSAYRRGGHSSPFETGRSKFIRADYLFCDKSFEYFGINLWVINQ